MRKHLDRFIVCATMIVPVDADEPRKRTQVGSVCTVYPQRGPQKDSAQLIIQSASLVPLQKARRIRQGEDQC
jgi:hypothetical protein